MAGPELSGPAILLTARSLVRAVPVALVALAAGIRHHLRIVAARGRDHLLAHLGRDDVEGVRRLVALDERGPTELVFPGGVAAALAGLGHVAVHAAAHARLGVHVVHDEQAHGSGLVHVVHDGLADLRLGGGDRGVVNAYRRAVESRRSAIGGVQRGDVALGQAGEGSVRGVAAQAVRVVLELQAAEAVVVAGAVLRHGEGRPLLEAVYIVTVGAGHALAGVVGVDGIDKLGVLLPVRLAVLAVRPLIETAGGQVADVVGDVVDARHVEALADLGGVAGVEAEAEGQVGILALAGVGRVALAAGLTLLVGAEQAGIDDRFA